jgi:hypothetical protein
MPTQVQFRRGTTAQNNSFTGAIGEISVNTSNNTIRVHDGTTTGGFELARRGNVSVLTSGTSAELAAVISDETGSGALVFATSPTLVTPILGTPQSVTLTNGTGLPISSGVSGLGTGIATFLATPSSANFATALTDESGSSTVAFTNSPVLLTPNIGTPSYAVLTNATSLPIVAGTTGTLSVARGGTGVTASTGTGSVVLSAAPTFTGTISAANLTLSGDLTVNGTTTTINSTTLTVDDKNIELGSVTSPSDVTADGGGITLKGATDKTFNWVSATAAWTSSEDLNLLTGKVFEINGTQVLSSSGLGSGILASNLTSVGTISSGTWQGSAISTTYTAAKVTSVNGQTGAATGFATTANSLSQFASTTSAQLATLISDETGSGALVFATSPSLTTPTLGVASATTVNKVTITTPATGSTLTIANGKTLTASNSLTFTGTDASSVAFGAGGTVLYSGGALGTPSSGTLTNANGLPIVAGTTGTLSVARGGTGATTSTGTGNVVLSDSPTLLTPALGTPSAIVLTNATGTASNLTANIANFISVSDDTSTNATRYPIFANGTSGAIVEQVSSTKLFFNPSTGLLTSTDYNSSSDKRLKKNIKTVSNAVETINALRGVTFEWKEGGIKSAGLIAQEVEKVLPDSVSIDDNGFMGIRYNNLIGILVEAVKDQQIQINSLKQQIEKLNG